MKPIELTTARLVLNQPTLDDVDLVTEYCQDPVFERFMLTPWPYQRSHAETFIGTVIPLGWQDDAEYSWALRRDGEFLGLIGYRTRARDLGYWLGAPHRGQGYMPEAVTAVADWILQTMASEIVWECVPGNRASAAVAHKCGFRFRGEGRSLYPDRSGAEGIAWHGALASTDSREPKSGWPL